jgi:hypothetical protein
VQSSALTEDHCQVEASQTKLMSSKEQIALELEMTQRALDRVVSENNHLHNEVKRLNQAIVDFDEEKVGIISEVFHFDGDESTGTAAQADVSTRSVVAAKKSVNAVNDSDVNISINEDCASVEIQRLGIEEDDGTE